LAPGLSSSLTAHVLVQKPNLNLYTYVALVFDPHVKIYGRKKRLTLYPESERIWFRISDIIGWSYIFENVKN
jgi:hypothetical protein